MSYREILQEDKVHDQILMCYNRQLCYCNTCVPGFKGSFPDTLYTRGIVIEVKSKNGITGNKVTENLIVNITLNP